LFTTFDAASGGNIVTQVKREFNGLGQLTSEWQSHSGAVTSNTPRVQSAYSEMASGVNHSRLTSITYPSGYVLTYNYSAGLNGSISRLSSLSDSPGTLESYDYLGLGTVVRRSHPQPNLDLTFLGTGPGSGGDQYVGLDSFGRVVDQHWKHGSTSTDRFTYTHDRNGNRLSKGNVLNSNFSESYSYDGLNQLSSFARGNGDTQSWDFDSLGNWDSVTTNGTTQTRSVNAQNEIAGISGAATPTYDANGNMTADETGKQFVYDAWNRLKVVKDSNGTTLKTHQYDAMNRRVAEVVGSDTTDLCYSSQWQVLEERVNGSGKYRYVWSPVYVDAMVLRDRPDTSERLWAQQDANFNVTANVNGSGSVVERYAYEVYGKATALSASWNAMSLSVFEWQYLYQSGRLDAVSRLYHFRNRDFASSLGRWTKNDPIAYSSQVSNLFLGLANNPIASLDPLGLITLDAATVMDVRSNVGDKPGGAFFWAIQWQLTNKPQNCTGLIAQHVQIDVQRDDKKSGPGFETTTIDFVIADPSIKNPKMYPKVIMKSLDYWEFWDVDENGKIKPAMNSRSLALSLFGSELKKPEYSTILKELQDVESHDLFGFPGILNPGTAETVTFIGNAIFLLGATYSEVKNVIGDSMAQFNSKTGAHGLYSFSTFDQEFRDDEQKIVANGVRWQNFLDKIPSDKKSNWVNRSVTSPIAGNGNTSKKAVFTKNNKPV
jgi:RHS repeat-associated protein